MKPANSNQLTLAVFLHAKPGKTEELGVRLRALVEPTRREEGCLNYDLHHSNENADVWMIYENWRSPADLDLHFQMPYLRDFVGRLGELLVTDMEIRRFAMVSTPATASR